MKHSACIIKNKLFIEWKKHKEINQGFIDYTLNVTLKKFLNIHNLCSVEIEVILSNNKYIHDLNLRFRGHDKPTNVLSFHQLDLDWKNILEFSPQNNYMFLGTIVFGYQTIKAEADLLSESFTDHFQALLVHGILHLLGFDHKEQDDTKAMEELEKEILLEL